MIDIKRSSFVPAVALVLAIGCSKTRFTPAGSYYLRDHFAERTDEGWAFLKLGMPGAEVRTQLERRGLAVDKDDDRKGPSGSVGARDTANWRIIAYLNDLGSLSSVSVSGDGVLVDLGAAETALARLGAPVQDTHSERRDWEARATWSSIASYSATAREPLAWATLEMRLQSRCSAPDPTAAGAVAVPWTPGVVLGMALPDVRSRFATASVTFTEENVLPSGMANPPPSDAYPHAKLRFQGQGDVGAGNATADACRGRIDAASLVVKGEEAVAAAARQAEARWGAPTSHSLSRDRQWETAPIATSLTASHAYGTPDAGESKWSFSISYRRPSAPR